MKRVCLVIFLSCMALVSSAQHADSSGSGRSFTWERFYPGGDLGLSFGTYTYVNLSPILGYKFNDRISAGGGPIYIYFRDNIDDISTSIYGGRVFGKCLLMSNVFAHVEPEYINREVYDLNGHLTRVNVFGFYVGGSLRQPVGGRTFLELTVLYNLLQGDYSPYSNPVVRMGIGF